MKERSLEARALKFLSQREHSRVELSKKLSVHAASTDELDRLLDSLERRGWLSDARFAEAVVNTRRSRFGAARIAFELKQKGIAAELVDAHSVKLRESELEAARSVWRKKFRAPPRTAEERAKQVRFLQGRGFASEIIFQILRTDD